MNVYIAAPFHDRELALTWKAKLEGWGHKVTSRWLLEHTTSYADLSEAQLAEEAAADLNDILASNAMLLLNTAPCTPGRMFEFGFATALGMPVAVYGDKVKSVFTHMPNVTHRTGELETWLAFDFNPEAIISTEPVGQKMTAVEVQVEPRG